MIESLLFLVATILLSFAINKLVILTPLRYIYQFIVRPGIIIHEISHYIACLITFAEVKKVSLFEKDGGFVKYSPSKIPLLGDFIINIAPIVAGSLLIIILSREIDIALPSNPKTFFQDSLSLMLESYKSIHFWIYFYCIITIGITLVPSTKDIKNIIIPIIILSIGLYFTRHTAYVGNIFELFSSYGLYVVSPLVFVLCLVVLLFIFSKFILKKP